MVVYFAVDSVDLVVVVPLSHAVMQCIWVEGGVIILHMYHIYLHLYQYLHVCGTAA